MVAYLGPAAALRRVGPNGLAVADQDLEAAWAEVVVVVEDLAADLVGTGVGGIVRCGSPGPRHRPT